MVPRVWYVVRRPSFRTLAGPMTPSMTLAVAERDRRDLAALPAAGLVSLLARQLGARDRPDLDLPAQVDVRDRLVQHPAAGALAGHERERSAPLAQIVVEALGAQPVGLAPEQDRLDTAADLGPGQADGGGRPAGHDVDHEPRRAGGRAATGLRGAALAGALDLGEPGDDDRVAGGRQRKHLRIARGRRVEHQAAEVRGGGRAEAVGAVEGTRPRAQRLDGQAARPTRPRVIDAIRWVDVDATTPLRRVVRSVVETPDTTPRPGPSARPPCCPSPGLPCCCSQGPGTPWCGSRPARRPARGCRAEPWSANAVGTSVAFSDSAVAVGTASAAVPVVMSVSPRIGARPRRRRNCDLAMVRPPSL